jgi:VWFA-related protein
VDLGPVPAQRRIRALALDGRHQPLYERTAVLNPGGRGLEVEFVTPVHGERVTGPVSVKLNVRAPADDDVETVTVGADAGDVTLSANASNPSVYTTVVHVPDGPTPLVARVVTKRGRAAEASLLLNTYGITTSSDAHVVEQMVNVTTKGGAPVENLSRDDFTVRDERGRCEIREVKLVKDTPLAVGFAVDTSISLRSNRELLRETATSFLEQVFKGGDAGFIHAFGPVVSKVRDWTASKETLVDDLGRLPETELAGTNLYQAVVEALYQFQGSQGARALILATDGEDYDGDVSETDALKYAKQSGVPIYALALGSETLALDPRFGARDPKARSVETPPNIEVLDRFTKATGGRTFVVTKGEDLRGVFRTIEKELRAQYLVCYVSNSRSEDAFHPVEVKSRAGVVHTAAGFFY